MHTAEAIAPVILFLVVYSTDRFTEASALFRLVVVNSVKHSGSAMAYTQATSAMKIHTSCNAMFVLFVAAVSASRMNSALLCVAGLAPAMQG